MRTTVRLDDALLARAKREAGRRGETLGSLIERGLRLALANPDKHPKRRHVEIPVCREGGGTLPGVDLDGSAALLDIIEKAAVDPAGRQRPPPSGTTAPTTHATGRGSTAR
jgi:hypothetical protein